MIKKFDALTIFRVFAHFAFLTILILLNILLCLLQNNVLNMPKEFTFESLISMRNKICFRIDKKFNNFERRICELRIRRIQLGFSLIERLKNYEEKTRINFTFHYPRVGKF